MDGMGDVCDTDDDDDGKNPVMYPAVKGILQDLLTRSALNFQNFLILTWLSSI